MRELEKKSWQSVLESLLAIRVIGCLLHLKNTIDEWQNFKEKELPNMNEKGNSIMQTLRLSYYYLPSHLKCCFAYYKLFPKDYEINIPYLVSLWVAQGFVKSNSEQSLQDIGLKYFKDLSWRSFFQEVEKDELGNLWSCEMHDLMHDLATQVAEDEIILLNSDAKHVGKKTRHLSINFEVESWEKVASCLPNMSKVRTFTSFNWSKKHDIKDVECDEIFFKLSRVRVINLRGFGIKRVPHSIDRLKHIRFLSLSDNKDIELLPNSIIKLQNLQTLYLVSCERLKQLPKHIEKLVNLENLYLEGCVSLTHMPRGIGQLTSLENLSLFMVAKDNSVSKHSGRLGVLHDLNNLGGYLEMMNLRYVKNPASEFKAVDLKEKQHLQSLRLSWKLGVPDNNSDGGPEDVENDEEMSLEELRPHFNLKSLIVLGCGRLLFPSWISPLTNLVGLTIHNCKKCLHFPPLDQFPSLKLLAIENFTDLESIESGTDGGNALFFPSLERLWLLNCPNLKGWRRDTSMPQLIQFHCLFYLEIRSCPNLTSMPLIPSVQQLVLKNANKKSLEDILKMKILVSQSTSSCYSISPSQLKILEIENIEDLEFLPEELMPNLISLQRLYIRYCPRITKVSSALRHLTFLEILVFVACEELDFSDSEYHSDMPWQHLLFVNLFKLASLPKGLQHVLTLRKLTIYNCPNLSSLPEWMGSLTELQYLWIRECPQLSERCKNKMGADWPKIAHIPNISIDDRWIQ